MTIKHGDSIFNENYATPTHMAKHHDKNCRCSFCRDHSINGWDKTKKTTIEDDGEITLYESSLGYEPFKE